MEDVCGGSSSPESSNIPRVLQVHDIVIICGLTLWRRTNVCCPVQETWSYQQLVDSCFQITSITSTCKVKAQFAAIFLRVLLSSRLHWVLPVVMELNVLTWQQMSTGPSGPVSRFDLLIKRMWWARRNSCGTKRRTSVAFLLLVKARTPRSKFH